RGATRGSDQSLHRIGGEDSAVAERTQARDRVRKEDRGRPRGIRRRVSGPVKAGEDRRSGLDVAATRRRIEEASFDPFFYDQVAVASVDRGEPRVAEVAQERER